MPRRRVDSKPGNLAAPAEVKQPIRVLTTAVNATDGKPVDHRVVVDEHERPDPGSLNQPGPRRRQDKRLSADRRESPRVHSDAVPQYDTRDSPHAHRRAGTRAYNRTCTQFVRAHGYTAMQSRSTTPGTVRTHTGVRVHVRTTGHARSSATMHASAADAGPRQASTTTQNPPLPARTTCTQPCRPDRRHARGCTCTPAYKPGRGHRSPPRTGQPTRRGVERRRPYGPTPDTLPAGEPCTQVHRSACPHVGTSACGSADMDDGTAADDRVVKAQMLTRRHARTRTSTPARPV